MASGSVPRRERQMVRVIALARLLMDGRRPNVYQLAARFGTRRETVYRDLRTLRDAGLPIIGNEAGRLSSPRLDPEFRKVLPPASFTRQEVAALTLAVKKVGKGQPFAGSLLTALMKLQGLVPGPDGRLAMGLDGAIGGWERGVKNYAGLEALVLDLVEAIVAQRRCLVEYQAPCGGKGTLGTYDTYWVAIADGTGGPAVAPHRISPTSGIPELPKLPVKRGREGVKSLVE